MVSKVKRRLYEYLTLYRPYTGSEIFLCSVNGTYTDISQDSIKSLFSRIRSKTGIKRLKPHLLRHTFATSFLLGGGDMESLRLYMGHASYETTQNYLHLADLYNRMGTEIYRLDKIFFKRYY